MPDSFSLRLPAPGRELASLSVSGAMDSAELEDLREAGAADVAHLADEIETLEARSKRAFRAVAKRIADLEARLAQLEAGK